MAMTVKSLKNGINNNRFISHQNSPFVSMEAKANYLLPYQFCDWIKQSTTLPYLNPVGISDKPLL